MRAAVVFIIAICVLIGHTTSQAIDASKDQTGILQAHLNAKTLDAKKVIDAKTLEKKEKGPKPQPTSFTDVSKSFQKNMMNTDHAYGRTRYKESKRTYIGK